jgi:HSP20 family protein
MSKEVKHPVQRVESHPLFDWNPLASFRREFQRVFDDYWPVMSAGNGGFAPSVDVSETDEAFKVRAEIPGVDQKDVEIAVSGNVLTLRGEKKQESERQERGMHVKECSHGIFERSIPLPSRVQIDRVEATYDKGIFTVTLPKTDEAKSMTRKIPVKAK